MLVLGALGATAAACPFCSAVSQTMDEELQSMQVAVFASLVEAADFNEEDLGEAELPLSRFRVVEIIKGQPNLKVGDEIQVAYFGPPDKTYTFLLMSPEQESLMWGNPLLLTAQGADYVRELRRLPADSARLRFFMNYLEHDDELLARDSYDEFAKAPYEDVIAINDAMDREKLIRWIKDEDVSVEHRRLYLTMLGVCGQPGDADLLETMIRSTDPVQRSGLNALVAAYLTLKGAAGLPLVNELFLTHPEAEYSDVHAAIMAIRFHGNETDVIPRSELLKSLRLVIRRKEIADLVIPDLARWEDWSVLPQLVELFETADPKSNWVRVPVVNYVRACPLPAAAEAMKQLEKIDPESVRRASALFPFVTGGPAPAPAQPDTSVDAGIAAATTPDQRPDPFANQQPVGLERDRSSTLGSASGPSADANRFTRGTPAWGIWLFSCLALLLFALVMRRVTTKAL
jgi:hypothetical protein